MTDNPHYQELPYYDRAGQPITRDEWAQMWAGDQETRRVAFDNLDSAAEVSTVWLGLDHGFGRGAPLIYETMIFGGPFDQHAWRYSTEDGALNGHRRVVRALIEGRNPESDIS